MVILFYYVVTIILIALSLTDIVCRIIPNGMLIILAMVILGFNIFVFHNGVNIFLTCAVFFIGFILFFCKFMGAGDVKLITCLSLATLNIQNFTDFILYMSLFGGGLAVAGYLLPFLKFKQRGVPYGVAISLGFITSFHPVVWGG